MQVAAAGEVCVLRENGTVECIPELASLASIDDATAISVGGSFACALRSQGVACWNFVAAYFPDTEVVGGDRIDGLIPNTAGALQVWVGGEHGCVLRADRSVACRGANQFGTLGDGTTERSDALVDVHGLRTLTAAHGGVVEVGGGYSHSCVRLASGTLACWGRNKRGQLGDGTKTDRKTPVMVKGIADAVAISGGLQFGCALRETGVVACWGHNGEGQLGDGTTKSRSTAKPVVGVTDVIAISSAQMHTCALTRGGEAWCWGDEIGTRPVKIDGVSDGRGIAAGASSCAVTLDGTAVCWGSDPHHVPYTPRTRWNTARRVFESGSARTPSDTDSARRTPMTPVVLAETALEKLREILSLPAGSVTPVAMRVAVVPAAAGGFSYYFGFIDADDPIDADLDDVFEEGNEGFHIVIRHDHVPYLLGTTIHWATATSQGSGFRFDNPNTTGRG